MTKSNKPIRGYHHTSRAWYGRACTARAKPDYIDDVTFGLYFDDEGGTRGEMTMKWTKLGGKPTAQLRVFDDAWAVLAGFPDLIVALGKCDTGSGGHRSGGRAITPLEFCALLDKCGFKDLTAVKSPYND